MDNKKINSVFAVYGIILVAFVLLFFVIPFNRNACTYSSFAFGLASILVGCGMTYRALTRGESVRSKVYGIPMFRIGYTYMAAQLVLSFIFFIANISKEIPAWISAVLGILMLAAALVGMIAVENAADVIEAVDNKIEEKIQQTKTFKLDISGLSDSCSDPEAKKLLEKLSEKLKYSDPVSSPALADIESKIEQGIEEIKGLISSGNADKLCEKIKALDMLVDERNRQCKAAK